MVSSTIKLNLESAIHKQEYSPDDYQFLLAKHTDHVII
jgi:hypothetical protein